MSDMKDIFRNMVLNQRLYIAPETLYVRVIGGFIFYDISGIRTKLTFISMTDFMKDISFLEKYNIIENRNHYYISRNEHSYENDEFDNIVYKKDN